MSKRPKGVAVKFQFSTLQTRIIPSHKLHISFLSSKYKGEGYAIQNIGD